VRSDVGKKAWFGHDECGVRIVDEQAEWTPLQRDFLVLANDIYGPDEDDIPDPPSRSSVPNY